MSFSRSLLFTFFFIGLALPGCMTVFPPDQIDPSGNMSRRDYLELRHRGLKDQEEDAPTTDESKAEAPAPAAAPSLPVQKETPPAPLAPSHLVSLTVTESVPLRDVLIELGREGKVNLEVDPRIKGGIIFSAHDQPFHLVLKRICDLAGLRYRATKDYVRVELDEPYQHSYSLDYLSLARRTTSEVAIATNVFDTDVTGQTGASTTSTRGNADNNSTSKIAATAEADFWSEIEKSLPQVLATSSGERALISGQRQGDQPKSNHSIDKQSGLVTVFGNSHQHEAVEKYLRRVQRKISAQVLIEARIIEVELSDQFQSGVNWTALFKGAQAATANFGAPGASSALSAAESGVFSATLDTKDFTGMINLVRTFGTARVLSSPRLTVMNNQTAVLKVARNEVYFLTTAQFPTTLSTAGVPVSGTPVFSSTPRTVPVGLVMTVQPAISNDTGRITMTLRPTISRVVDRVKDPSIGLNAASAGISSPVQSEVPVLAVREMDSVLQLQSGEVAVMGGLMQDSSENQDQGVPPFDTLPVLGNLAKSRSNDGRTSELVILLRATILDNAAPDDADRDLYEKYNNDPRPLPLPTQQPDKGPLS